MSTIARSLASSLGGSLAHAFLPPTCCLCGAQGQAPSLDLCAGCATLLPLNAPADSAFPSVDSNVVRTLVPFQYAYPVDRLIRALKFRGERTYARVLGTLLAQNVLALRQITPQLIVPIPLHPLRYRERGFNQAHEIARYAAALLRIPVGMQYVRRRVPTLEQSGLSLAERRRNVRGAFEVMRPIEATRVALVDDVLTTGSTALAAARALSDAGVQQVEIWAVARVRLG